MSREGKARFEISHQINSKNAPRNGTVSGMKVSTWTIYGKGRRSVRTKSAHDILSQHTGSTLRRQKALSGHRNQGKHRDIDPRSPARAVDGERKYPIGRETPDIMVGVDSLTEEKLDDEGWPPFPVPHVQAVTSFQDSVMVLRMRIVSWSRLYASGAPGDHCRTSEEKGHKPGFCHMTGRRLLKNLHLRRRKIQPILGHLQ